MTMEINSTKMNQCRRSRLPVDSPLALFWGCKNSPSLYKMDHKCPCVLALELYYFRYRDRTRGRLILEAEFEKKAGLWLWYYDV